MTKITAMRGFSGSGKSTLAREIADQTGAVVVNRDLLRMQLLGEWWTGEKEDEDRVTIAEQAQVVALLQAQVPVVIDATHLNPQFPRNWAKLATRMGVEFEMVDVRADVEECKRRVYQRWESEMGTPLSRYLDPNVVEQQAKRYPEAKWPAITAHPTLDIVPVERGKCLPSAIIYDLDGTAAIHTGRSPYDYTRVMEDEPNLVLRDILWQMKDSHYLIACSGRDDTCRGDSEKWLKKYGFAYDLLLMRDTVNDRTSGQKWPDVQVKLRLFNENVRGRYNVEAVFDDRLQVCRLWHQLGLQLFRAGDPEADF
ncbi:3'-phosphatase, 5'-polynucleotide kinase [Mycobacterium phage WXIN]|nr:3'-phosphatase, 5'-polynucleotide kinase [Mycobacterium phage WXIN]